MKLKPIFSLNILLQASNDLQYVLHILTPYDSHTAMRCETFLHNIYLAFSLLQGSLV